LQIAINIKAHVYSTAVAIHYGEAVNYLVIVKLKCKNPQYHK